MLKRTLFLLQLLLQLPIALLAQELIFQSVGGGLILPSSECYSITQDPKGYLWIATEQGLVRYDGGTAKLFSATEGLPEKAVYAVGVDLLGRMWFATSRNRLLRYVGGKLVETPSDIPVKLGDKKFYNNIYDLKTIGGKMHIQTPRQSYLLDNKLRAITKFPVKSKADDLVFELSDSAIVSNNTNYFADRKTNFQSPQRINVLVNAGKRYARFVMNFDRVADLNWRVLAQQSGRYSFFIFNDRLVRIDAQLKHEIYRLAAPAISFYRDRDGGLWIGTVKKGVVYIPSPKHPTLQITSLNGYSVSGICEDREGNVWCTTLENGVYVSASKHLRRYGIPGISFVPPAQMWRAGDRLFVAPENFGLLAVDQFSNFKTIKAIGNSRVRSVAYYGGSFKVSLNDRLAILDQRLSPKNNARFLFSDTYFRDVSIYDNTTERNGKVYSITHDKILQHTEKGIVTITMLKSPGRCIEYLNDSTLVFGCANGLYSLHLPTGRENRFPDIEHTVTAIMPNRGTELWVATKGNGLYRISADGKIERMDVQLGLGTDVFYDLHTDRSGTIWCATNSGLRKLSLSRGHWSAERIGVDEGLPGGDVYRIAIHAEQCYLLTPDGLLSFPSSISLRPRVRPVLVGVRVTSKAKQVKGTAVLKLPASGHSLMFTFSVASYRNRAIKISYRLRADNSFVSVSGNQLLFQDLKPGDYQLEAFAVAANGMRSKETVRFSFAVASPFYLTWWFICLGLLTLLLLLFTVRKWQISRIEKREREKDRINVLIAQSKLAALQARMNPHFIFNAINSIQNYIITNRTTDASQYLTKFSRLIRLVLKQSGEKTISLQEEIDTLKLYCELEKLRFKEAFDYDITVDPALDAYHIHVPTMFIQPYVENAIWHGLTSLRGQRRGKLQIVVVSFENELLISITDNGIGRKMAAEMQPQKNYVSAGMMLTEQRLKTMQEIFPKGSFKVKVLDLEMGTRVEITLSLTEDS
ncbi:sensor histidine kinase [Nubsella zeaxanthinifaciens]|uniref:sensor histidine kinase n=1 Tax=Nubsella zeaxanthinifaciens TaxID=392412 RepID=UPI0018E5A256|nr:histidine kinase [Nubsella zeaxanthinifaciens]